MTVPVITCTEDAPSMVSIMDEEVSEKSNLIKAISSPTIIDKKEIGLQTCTFNVKTFRSVKTQTDTNILTNAAECATESGKHLEDKNLVGHLQHHSYSAGPPKSSPHPEPAENQGSDSELDGNFSSDDSPMYSPSSDSEDIESEDDNVNPTEEKKLIVFESELDKLFKFCQQCGNITTTKTKQFKGSMIIIKTTCLHGHSNTWQSQPLMNGAAIGNLLIPAAILFSGNTYQHIYDFAKFLNVQFVSSSYYYKIQEKHLLPVVNNKWKSSQAEIVQQLSQVSHVDICGDGRCDSPGHSAKYGTYTIMDETTKKVIEFSIVQVTEVTSSNAMEYEGCKRTLNSLLEKKVPVRCMTTDRHTTITARMRSVYPKIKHQYDVWHLSKWVTKKLNKKAKKKSFAELMPWIQAISNHLWWCASTCGGDPNMLRERWISVLYHIVDKHRWAGHQLFKKCGHCTMSRRERKSIKWLKAGSPSHVALEEIVTNKKLLNDIEKLTEFHHTGELEQYHSVLLKYAPKREHFSYNGMVARTQLAMLDHNAHVNRKQAVVRKGTKQGEKRFNVVCPKQRKNWVAKPIKEPKSYEYINSMMKDVLLVKGGQHIDYEPVIQAKCIAPIPKPPKQEVIDRHKSRMKR